MTGRVAWPVVIRLENIEQATASDAGNFAARSVAPFAVPPMVSRWIGTFCVNTSDPIIALTYDDGPHPVHTPQILDVLAARGATATFFVLAEQVELYPEIARRIIVEGHELALHGIDHASLLTMTSREAARIVEQAKRRVEAVVGSPVHLYRPPYGEYTWQQAIRLRMLGLEVIIWSGDSRDWASSDEDEIIARTIAHSIPGGIILMHDNRGDPETIAPDEVAHDYDRAKVLGEILEQLHESRYRTARVGEMLDAHQRVRSIARYGLDRIGQENAPA
jgi:peptidoglycan/xylan/chitin deacetylase (PgdA/CDA1 family)